jgi:hypothetical protein
MERIFCFVLILKIFNKDFSNYFYFKLFSLLTIILIFTYNFN